MKTLLLHIDLDKGLNKRVDAARALAEKYASHVMACHVTPLVNVYAPYPGAMPLPEEMMESARDIWTQNAKKARTKFEEYWPSAGPAWEWIDETGITEDVLTEQARLADLTIVGNMTSHGQPATLAGDITVATGLPVLALPSEAAAPLGGKPVLIAWNNCLEAAHAIRHAMPFLKEASEVIVAEIAEDDADSMPAADIAPYLARHNLNVKVMRQQGDDIAGALISMAKTAGAELIVAGAYGHTRLREYVFGGVTRDLLENTDIPLLLCH